MFFFFPAKQKTAQFLPFIFCFIRELNLYPPLTYSLTSARELKPFTPPLHLSLRPSLRLSIRERRQTNRRRRLV
jgi:hypothetical protein